MENMKLLYTPILLFAFILTVLLEKRILPILNKKAEQPIYSEGPAWHSKKAGTPTMGGVAFLISISLILVLSCAFLFSFGEADSAWSMILVLFYSVLNSAIGIIDDSIKLKRKSNGGLTPIQKLALQAVFAAIFLALRAYIFKDETNITIGDFTLKLGFLYYALAFIMLLGIVNCANLTDGIDGLAASVAFAIGLFYFFLSFICGFESSIISAAMVGASLGFLIFNINPAKVFMGDTGSLFLGALSVSQAFSLNTPFFSLFIFGVYIIEGISVILQVAYFKITKKRLFKMAPIHHHLEKCGMDEMKICMIGIIITLILSIPCYILYSL